MIKQEPLDYFYAIYGYDPGDIRQIIPGRKYVSVLMKTGHLGVCSTLRMNVSQKDIQFHEPDLDYFPHRIVYNAYLNAVLNYRVTPEDQKDIFEHINFSQKKSVIMVGNFRPVVKKFRHAGFPLTVFDRVDDDGSLQPYDQLPDYLSKAKTVILTSTTLFNKTFLDLVEQTPQGCHIIMLGPSSILHPDLKKFKNISGIYGVLFGLFDTRVSDLIGKGQGTSAFLRYAKKVNI